MTSVPSAISWGSPTATKRALLLHGLSSSAHTWHRVATSLAAQGYFVTAPNLIGHGLRTYSDSGSDLRVGAIAQDLRPYLEAKPYSLIIGHSLGGSTTLALAAAHLSPSQPTAIVLVDTPLQALPETISLLTSVFAESCKHPKSADAYRTENPLWTAEDGVFRELGTRMCSPETVHGIFGQNDPWHFFEYLDTAVKRSNKWRWTALLAEPIIGLPVACTIEELEPYPQIRPVLVPGASHWIQNDFPDVVTEEALKTVAELEIA